MVKGIEHLAICAKDTLKLKEWYIKMFDFKEVYDNGKGIYFLKAQDGAMIEFIPSERDNVDTEAKAKGIRHIAIAVDDFEGMCDRLRAENVEVISQTPASSDVKTFFFRDIEGNILHLIFRPNPL